VLFRNDDAEASARVRWPVLGDGPFILRAVEGGEPLGPYSGAALRQGVSLALPATNHVGILEIRRRP
jgi:hypothetical protein